MPVNRRFLLLQVRDPDDPMREHEIQCFARSFRCSTDQIRIFDLLSGVPSKEALDEVDVVLLGGSGDYSVAKGGPWLPAALDAMRELYEYSKPTFASCWGFQAMARAMGGEVVTDHDLAEVGSLTLNLTPEGLQDPVFGALGPHFQVQIGHEDIVTQLPAGAVLLASSDRVQNEAFRFEGKPIYCTQFPPGARSARHYQTHRLLPHVPTAHWACNVGRVCRGDPRDTGNRSDPETIPAGGVRRRTSTRPLSPPLSRPLSPPRVTSRGHTVVD